MKAILTWFNENKAALIVGFAAGAVVAWLLRATIARIIGG